LQRIGSQRDLTIVWGWDAELHRPDFPNGIIAGLFRCLKVGNDLWCELTA